MTEERRGCCQRRQRVKLVVQRIGAAPHFVGQAAVGLLRRKNRALALERPVNEILTIEDQARLGHGIGRPEPQIAKPGHRRRFIVPIVEVIHSIDQPGFEIIDLAAASTTHFLITRRFYEGIVYFYVITL